MAYLDISCNGTTITWQIKGLSYPFAQTVYINGERSTGYLCAGIANAPFTQAAPTVGNLVDSVSAPSTNTKYETDARTVTWPGTDSGRYTLYAFTQVVSDRMCYPAGSGTITVTVGGSSTPGTNPGTTPGTTPTPTRPKIWRWRSTVAKGYDFNISALEWSDFQQNINAVRVYKGLPTYGFTVPVSGGDFTMRMMNDVVWAIGAMDRSAYGYEVQQNYYTGEKPDVSANSLQMLAKILNSIT